MELRRSVEAIKKKKNQSDETISSFWKWGPKEINQKGNFERL